MPPVYRFGPFEVDPGANTLSKNGNRVRLQDLPYRLLALLVERHGEVVSREEVRQRLWNENTFVEFDNSLGVAVRKIRDALGDDADAPRYLETIPRRGYRFVAPVTDIGSKSNSSVAERDLNKDVPANTLPPAEVPPSVSPGRSWILVGLALVVVGAIALAYLSVRHRESKAAVADAPAPVRIRRSVAVLGFRNLPGRTEDNWLSPAFSEMLSTELAADGALRLVSGEDVARAKSELLLADEDTLAKATLAKLRTDPGADVVLLGSYTPLPGKGEKRIRLDVRLQDTAQGETIAEKAFEGNEDDLFDLVGHAGSALRQSLGSAPVSTQVSAQARAALPSKPLAVRLYTEGQSRLWAFDYIHARDSLIQAVAAEPDFPLSHSALSEAWNHLGYTQKSRDEAEKARSLSEHLGPEEHLLIEAQYYSTLLDRNKAVEAYRKLFTHFPDSLDYGLRLADEQRWVNPQDALQTLASLRRLPAPVGNDPRIDMLEARSWINKDLVKAQAAAHLAIQKGTAQGSQQLVARAYGILCQVSGGGTSTLQGLKNCEKARQAYAAFGDSSNVARTMNDLAGLYYQQGDLNRSEALFREAIVVFRQVGDIQGLTTSSSNLGDIALARGDLTEATLSLSEAVPGYREIGDKDGVALTLNDLGAVARLRGDLGAALTNYQQAQSSAQEIDDKRALAYVANGIGEVFLDRGDLEAAHKSFEESLSLRKQIGDSQTVAETELSLAQLSIEEHRAADAEAVIRKCMEQFHQNQQADDELSARVALIKAFLAEQKYPEATKEAEDSRSLAGKSGSEPIRLQFDLVSARTELATNNLKSARTKMERTLNDVQTCQLFGLELEARLALAELKDKSGERAAANADLLALEKDSRHKGFGLVAQKAASMRSPGQKPPQKANPGL